MLRLRRWFQEHEPARGWLDRLEERIREDEDTYLYFRKW